MLTLFYFALAIVLLVSVHEFGHFITARLCGVKVLRFSFGFGPVLWRRVDKKGTEYAFSLLPLGGYVKMLDETEGPVREKEKPFAFNRQSLLKRTAIVLAGPLFNFLFAFFAFWLVSVIGMTVLAPVVGQVKQGSIAAQAGLVHGDELLALNGEPINSWRDFQLAFLSAMGRAESLSLTVKTKALSSDRTATKNIDLLLKDWSSQNVKQDVLGRLGIMPFIPELPPVIGQVLPDSAGEKAGLHAMDRILRLNGQPVPDWLSLVEQVKTMPHQAVMLDIQRAGHTITLPVRVGVKTIDGRSIGFLGLISQKPDWPLNLLRIERETPWAAIPKALMQTVRMTGMTFDMFARLVMGRVSLDNLSGPVGIAQSAGESGRSGLVYYVSFLALVSLSLGVLNLLPVPVLDGGHLLYYLIEGVSRKPVSARFQVVGNMVGLSLLVMLMVFSLVNDLTRLSG